MLGRTTTECLLRQGSSGHDRYLSRVPNDCSYHHTGCTAPETIECKQAICPLCGTRPNHAHYDAVHRAGIRLKR
ncbi:hypothetical protein TNCV_1589821 [Trichonephila clavipes]|uniref:Uncharacterized protein n=1 Tax=Trichonephila clavipes TaxID=2585209 RepID=A0A8X6REL2_TRICX|nr:hypothetical protein TNCV_1589821 [Trichonephila clavipes]